MGLGAEIILANALNPGAGGAVASVANSGDTLSVRNYAPGSKAYLAYLARMGATAGFAQVRSPLMHDNVQGIRITPNESPSIFAIPAASNQQLQPQDTLIPSVSGGAAETDLVFYCVWYQNLGGASARLRNFSDIDPIVKSVKPIQVAVTTSATIGAWQDTLITTTENLLHANTDYAVLGYSANVALAAVAVKGIDTGNLRIGGPGATQEFPTTQFFYWMAQQTGDPWIPVINAANANGTFVSTAAATASVAAIVELMVAELTQSVGS